MVSHRKNKMCNAIAGFLFGFTALTAVPLVASAQDTPSMEEMWHIIKEQQREIDRLKKANGKPSRRSLDGAVVTTATAVDADAPNDISDDPDADADAVDDLGPIEGFGDSGWWQRTSIGGYGEMHYNAGGTDEIDFHRYVLVVEHQFNERIRMFSEIELEHSLVEDTSDGSGPGELELEQAYIEIDLVQGGQCGANDDAEDANGPSPSYLALPADCTDFGTHSLRAGVMLIPVGILNEVHEPPTFYGVERNPVENAIIPTTWWEGGVGLRGNFGSSGLSYDAMFHSGFSTPTTGSNAFKVRNGRQKVAKAVAKDSAVTGRLKYTGIPGVELAFTAHHQFDIAQKKQDVIGVNNAVQATLLEGHTDIKREIFENVTFGLRALYARWVLNGGDPGLNPKLFGRELQQGWYVEPSLRFVIGEKLGDIGFFYRHSEWDNEAGNSTPTQFSQNAYGFNYWPHPDVVFKFDYQDDLHDDVTKEDDRVNLGVGFQF
jgi:hypothetical protein